MHPPRSIGCVIAAAAACTAAGRAGAPSRRRPCIRSLWAGRRHWRAASAIVCLRGEAMKERLRACSGSLLALPCSMWLLRYHTATHKTVLAAPINTKAHQVPAQRAAEGGAHPPRLRGRPTRQGACSVSRRGFSRTPRLHNGLASHISGSSPKPARLLMHLHGCSAGRQECCQLCPTRRLGLAPAAPAQAPRVQARQSTWCSTALGSRASPAAPADRQHEELVAVMLWHEHKAARTGLNALRSPSIQSQ